MEKLRNDSVQYIVLQENEHEIKNKSDILMTKMDPFTHRLNMTYLDILKLVINVLWLFPLRLCLVVPSFLILCTLGLIVNIGNIRQDEEEPRPLTGWRKFIAHRLAMIVNRVFLFGFGFHWIRIKGQPLPTSVAPITVAAPHSSPFDMFILSLTEAPSFVAKAEFKQVPVLGRIYEHVMKCIFVSRNDPDSRQQCIEEICRRLNSTDVWPPILIFPEGTSTNRKVIIRFKSGAFSPKVPVQPVVIRHRNRLNTLIFTENGIGLVMGFFLTLCQFNNSVELEYLPLYTPSEEEKDDPVVYAENVRDLMSVSAGICKSQHSFEDVALIRISKELGLPYETGLVEFGQTARPYNITYIQVEYLLKRFANIDTNKDGMISIEDLAVFLKVPHDTCLQSVFDSFDTDVDGLVSFRKYAFGILHQSKLLLRNNQLVQQVFEFFDSDSDGQVTRDDLLKLPLQVELKNIRNIHEDQIVYAKCGFFCKCGQFTKLNSRRHITDEELGEQDNYLNLLELPGPWNFDQFKQLLTDNPDYLLLFHEYQNAGLSGLRREE